jgi:hypothetical protein
MKMRLGRRGNAVNGTVNALLISAVALGGTLFAELASAQNSEMGSLKRQIDVLSAVLEESLGLSGSSGLLGLSTGGVEGSYLQGQGVVLEIRTPLSGQRSRLGLASLGNAVRSLIPQSNSNPFAMLRASASASASADANAAAGASPTAAESGSWRQSMDAMANIDYSLVVSNALQQSSNALLALKDLSQIDAQEQAALQQQLDSLRSELQANVSRLRSLAEQQDAASGWQQQLDNLLLEIEPLKQRSIELAADLKQRAKTAEEAAAANWTAEVAGFETQLLSTLCQQGAVLTALPAGERVTAVLVGLGGSVQDEEHSDKIHVLQGSDMKSCQAEEIDVDGLRERVVSYSY